MAEEKTAEELAEEAAAQIAEGNKQTETTETEEVKPETTKVEAKQPSLEEVVSRLAEVMRPAVGLTPEQQEIELKKIEDESGFTRKQLGWMAKSVPAASLQANLASHQEIGRQRAKEALGTAAEKLLATVEEEMKKQPANVQANPEAWRNMAWLVRGRSGETASSGQRRTVVNPGLSESRGAAGGDGKTPKASGKKYNDEEKFIIDKYFGGKADEYEKRKGEKRVGMVRESDFKKGTGVADAELNRLTGGRMVS